MSQPNEYDDEPMLPPSLDEEDTDYQDRDALAPSTIAGQATFDIASPSASSRRTESAVVQSVNGFVGRDGEQRAWRTILYDVLENKRGGFLNMLLAGNANPTRRTSADGRNIAAHVVVIHGEAAVGKTALAMRLREIVQKEKAFTRRFRTSWLDWANVARQDRRVRNNSTEFDPLAFLDALHNHFVREDRFGTFDYYRRALAKHQTAQAQIDQVVGTLAMEIRQGVFGTANDSDAANDLQWLSGLDAAGLAFAVRQLAPSFATTHAEPRAVAGIAPSLAGLRAFDALLQKRLGQNYSALVEPATTLAQAVGADVENIAADKPLIVFFDDYDAVDRADPILQTLMAYGGARCIWVLLDTHDLSDNRAVGDENTQRGYANSVQRGRFTSMPLSGFNTAEAILYLDVVAGHLLDTTATTQVLAAVGGAPLALGAFGQLLSFEMRVDDAAQALAAQDTAAVLARFAEFLVVSGHPDRVALAALALAPTADVGLLAAMLDVGADSLDFQEVVQRLYERYSYLFVGEHRLHSLTAAAFRRYLLLPDQRYSDSFPTKRVNRRAAAYVVRRLVAWQQNFGSVRGRVRDAKWSEWATTLAWHLLWLDEAQAWRLIVPLYVAATAYQPDLVPRLLDTVAFFIAHGALSHDGRELADVLEAAGRLDFADRSRAVTAWLKIGQHLHSVGLTGVTALDSLTANTATTSDALPHEILPLQATIAYRLALAYFYAGNWRAAATAAARALELDPRGLAVPGDDVRAVLAEAQREAITGI